MKKLFAALIVLGLGFSFTACSSLLSTTSGNVEIGLETSNDVFTLQAVTASSLLNTNQVTLSVSPLSFEVLEEVPTDEPIVSDEIDEVDRYLAMVEQFLGTNNGFNVTVLQSDLPEWTYMISYEVNNLLGETQVYTLYYNETVYEPIIETEDDETETTNPLAFGDHQSGDKPFRFDDDDDEKVQYVLTGILVAGNDTYTLEGKKVVEEDEEVFRLRSYIDEFNYVKVEYKTEDGGEEQKFFYEVVTDGVVVSRSKAFIENEDEELKVKVELIENATTTKFEYKQEVEENVTVMKIRYEISDQTGLLESGNIRILATVDPLTGEITYDYQVMPEGKDGKMHEYEKKHEHRFGHDDDDDDNDDDNDDVEDDDDDEVVTTEADSANL